MKKFVLGIGSVMMGASVWAAGPVTVKTTIPELIRESEGQVAVGRVEGSHSVKLSARVVGTLWERKGEEGERVKKDDVLFRIEDTVYKANLVTAKANAAELEAKLAMSEIEVKRYTDSELKGGVSKSERDRTILTRDVNKAKLEAARAQVALCENDLSYCTVKSPIDGVLGRTIYDVGNNVGPGNGTLRDVICTDPIDVTVALPEQVLRWAFDNREQRESVRLRLLRSDGVEVPVQLKLFAVDNKVDSATGTVAVRFRGANPNSVIAPGGYVKLVVSAIFKTPRLAVPMSAIVFEGERRFVYAVRDSKAVKLEVKLGQTVGDRIFVETGLAEGEAIVSAGTHKLVDGAAVIVK